MESFNQGEQTDIVAFFLDIEEAFDNVWHSQVRYKISMLEVPTKMTHWLSDLLVGHTIQFRVNSFVSNHINPRAAVPQGCVISPFTLSYLHQ